MCTDIHHVAAISENLQRTVAFYQGILGLKLIKKVSLFEGPKVCHFYWGKELDSFITFYNCPGLNKGKIGINTIGRISFLAYKKGLKFWEQRMSHYGIPFRVTIDEAEDCAAFNFCDPDGLQLKLVFAAAEQQTINQDEHFGDCNTIKGLYGIEIITSTGIGFESLFTEKLGMSKQRLTENHCRYHTSSQRGPGIIDVHTGFRKTMPVNGVGMVHHLAFRVGFWNQFLLLYDHFTQQNHNTIFKKYSSDYDALYFRDAGGMLFEIIGRRPERFHSGLWGLVKGNPEGNFRYLKDDGSWTSFLNFPS